MKILLTIITLIAFSSCGDFINGFKSGYDESFDTSFKSSFITSCTEDIKNEAHEVLCTCLVDDLIATFPPKELRKTDKMKEHMTNISIKKCL
ncbi:MAG: hypothetical protein HRU38_12190 [Saccharospirillaceae bacterium]|nr:hypothetical protein [Saccharospirillaceae bacterium]